MTFKAAQSAHLAALAALGWSVAAHLKVPHATRADGLRLFFKAQSVYVTTGRDLGSARSTHDDPRAVTTAALIASAEHFTRP